jgi:hypothetical protein
MHLKGAISEKRSQAHAESQNTAPVILKRNLSQTSVWQFITFAYDIDSQITPIQM